MQKLEDKIIIRKDLFYYFPILILLSVIVGNRGGTRDTQAYFEVFKSINKFDLFDPALFYIQSGMEIGFGWYSYIISLFSDSSFVLFGFYSFLTFYFVYKTCEKMNIRLKYTLLLYLSSAYFVLQQFMQIRQGLATPIALYAVVLLYKEGKVSLKFWLMSLLAVSMHQIAFMPILVGFILYFFRNRIEKTSLIWFKIYSLVFLVVAIFFSKLVLVNFLSQFSERVLVYSESEEYAQDLGLFRLPNIKAFLTFLLFLFLTNGKLYKNKIYVLFYLFFALSLAFRIGFIDFGILSGRFSTVFAYSEIFILPLVFLRFKAPFGVFFLLLFTCFQAIATYGFQVPPDFYESYFNPLN